MTLDVHFMAQRMDWQTPPALFARLDKEFDFTLDAAASAENACCATYFTEADNALIQPWDGRVWVNPPYGRAGGQFMAYAWQMVYEAQTAEVVVLLVPARTDTQAWHTYAMRGAEIRLIQGRIQFVGAPNAAPFPSCILVFRQTAAPLAVRSLVLTAHERGVA